MGEGLYHAGRAGPVPQEASRAVVNDYTLLMTFHRYFFHATEARKNTDEYNADEAAQEEEEGQSANNGDESVTEDESEPEGAQQPSTSSAGKQERTPKEEENDDDTLMNGPPC